MVEVSTEVTTSKWEARELHDAFLRHPEDT